MLALAAAGQDSQLREIIAPNAKFTLGHVDHILGYPDGLDGAHRFAKDVAASTYAFEPHVGGPNMPRDPCGPQDVGVQFINSDSSMSTTVKFHFESGLLASAEGYSRDRYAGPVRLEAH